MSPPEPSAQDRENARRRSAISARQNGEYAEALKLALSLGPDYKPWMKLSLIDSDHRNTGNTKPVATAYKVYRGERRLTENAVYLRRMPDDQVMTADSYEPLFGDLLREEHPTKRVEIRGKIVPAPKWTLVWSAMELYAPKSAEQLSAMRTGRERKKEEREERKWAEREPLWTALAEREREREREREAEEKGR